VTVCAASSSGDMRRTNASMGPVNGEGLFDNIVSRVQIEYSQFYNLSQNIIEEQAIQRFQMSLRAGSSVACPGAYSHLTTLRLLSSVRCHITLPFRLLEFSVCSAELATGRTVTHIVLQGQARCIAEISRQKKGTKNRISTSYLGARFRRAHPCVLFVEGLESAMLLKRHSDSDSSSQPGNGDAPQTWSLCR
jgi:hypothetical protein